jgi:hypothetical protein
MLKQWWDPGGKQHPDIFCAYAVGSAFMVRSVSGTGKTGVDWIPACAGMTTLLLSQRPVLFWIPACAGITTLLLSQCPVLFWIPACAGMTTLLLSQCPVLFWIPACAGVTAGKTTLCVAVGLSVCHRNKSRLSFMDTGIEPFYFRPCPISAGERLKQWSH